MEKEMIDFQVYEKMKQEKKTLFKLNEKCYNSKCGLRKIKFFLVYSPRKRG